MRKLTIATVAALLPLAFAAPALANVTTSHASTTGVSSSASSTGQTKGVHKGSLLAKKVVKTVQGTVKATDSGSFVLTVRNTDYTVTVGTSVHIVNRTWHKISLSDIKVGDKVRVYGAISGTGITAQIVRDISLPVPVAENATSTSAH